MGGGILSGSSIGIIISTFVACAVEMVEVTTIVIGVGIVRGWKSTLIGSAAGLVILAGVIIGLGSQISNIPIHWLRLVVGALLLTFGLSWLRKSILAYARGGDEEEGQADDRKAESKFGVSDWYAFTLAFKGTLLEGLEIVFIILTFGASSGNLLSSQLGGVAAIVVMGLAALFAKNQIARIPEKALKFIVGVLLTTFGTFWTAKGAFAHWPAGDFAIAGLAIVYFLAALGFVWMAKTMMPASKQQGGAS